MNVPAVPIMVTMEVGSTAAYSDVWNKFEKNESIARLDSKAKPRMGDRTTPSSYIARNYDILPTCLFMILEDK